MFSSKSNSFAKKTAPTTLPRRAGSASTTFFVSLLRIYASMFNHFLKALSAIGGDYQETVGALPPKTPVISIITFEMFLR